MIVDVFGNPAFDKPDEAINTAAIAAYLKRGGGLWCPITVGPLGAESVVTDCGKPATSFAACYEPEGVWQTEPVCAFHANRAGKSNVATIETILQATKDAS